MRKLATSPTSPRGSYEEVNDVTRKLRGTRPSGIWPLQSHTVLIKTMTQTNCMQQLQHFAVSSTTWLARPCRGPASPHMPAENDKYGSDNALPTRCDAWALTFPPSWSLQHQNTRHRLHDMQSHTTLLTEQHSHCPHVQSLHEYTSTITRITHTTTSIHRHRVAVHLQDMLTASKLPCYSFQQCALQSVTRLTTANSAYVQTTLCPPKTRQV